MEQVSIWHLVMNTVIALAGESWLWTPIATRAEHRMLLQSTLKNMVGQFVELLCTTIKTSTRLVSGTSQEVEIPADIRPHIVDVIHGGEIPLSIRYLLSHMKQHVKVIRISLAGRKPSLTFRC